MVQIYRTRWKRKLFKSLIGYFRDAVIGILPISRLPMVLVRLFYGIDAKFAFFVHPRRYDDVFISAPFLEPTKFIFRKNRAFNFVSKISPFVVNVIRTKQGVNGFVIGHPILPDIMFRERKRTIKILANMLRFASKILPKGAVIGLGGWFPMVTQRGELVKNYAEKYGLIVTNGHCGTLASIFLTVEKIARIAGLEMPNVNLAILGVGKMGTNVARAFNGRINRLILVDINRVNLLKIKELLTKTSGSTKIDCFCSAESDSAIKNALKISHIGVCATSTYRNLVRLKDLPSGYVAIDDSRPEALPRDPKKEKIILEGGLLKIEGATVDYDFGFGEDDNVFGCLGEAFLLALDGCNKLEPTIGDINMNNFFTMLDFSKENGVFEGDLKSSNLRISDQDISSAITQRLNHVQESQITSTDKE